MTSKVKGRVECRKFLHDTAPRYGLRYGPAPATGNFQRLRGRPPLVSPLKLCMRRSFTAVTRVQIPSGTPTLSTTCGIAGFGALRVALRLSCWITPRWALRFSSDIALS